MRPTALLALTAVLLVAGCGSIGDGGDMTADDGKDGDVAQSPATELTVTVRSGPEAPERTYTLTCEPTGGDHPDPEAACRALDELDDPFAPVPPDVMCTQIYGGPQTAVVTGMFRGKAVNARFDRTDGCQISRWDEHVAILVERGGA